MVEEAPPLRDVEVSPVRVEGLGVVEEVALGASVAWVVEEVALGASVAWVVEEVALGASVAWVVEEASGTGGSWLAAFWSQEEPLAAFPGGDMQHTRPSTT